MVIQFVTSKTLVFSPPLSFITPLNTNTKTRELHGLSNYKAIVSGHSYYNSSLLLTKTSKTYKNNNNNKNNSRSSSNSSKCQVVASGNNVGAPLWHTWSPDKASPSPCISDVLWPSLGAFAAMAMLGKMDQMLATRGVSITVAPLGAVCAVLFITPKSPAARKYNMFLAQIGCAAIGVLAFSVFGPGWLARSTALAASIAFMISTKSTHPPAASLPLLFIDGAKFHGLNFWYALFPGAAGCIIISLIQEIVSYLQENFKF